MKPVAVRLDVGNKVQRSMKPVAVRLDVGNKVRDQWNL